MRDGQSSSIQPLTELEAIDSSELDVYDQAIHPVELEKLFESDFSRAKNGTLVSMPAQQASERSAN
jgi:hypothetical protein